jgi:UDP-glucose 4-epimerase
MRERGLPMTIVRLFNVSGPRQTGQWGMVLPRFVEAAKTGQPLRVHGDGEQTRCFCHVADAVEALLRLRACEAARGEVVNVGNDVAITIRELAQRVIAELRSASVIETIPYEQAYAAGFEDMRHRRPDLAKLEQLTGFRPRRDLAEIIRDLAA